MGQRSGTLTCAFRLAFLFLLAVAVACQPAAAPTAAPAKPAATTAPAAPAATTAPAAKPAATTAPAAPAATTAPAAPKPTEAAAAKPAAQPSGKLTVAVGQWGTETPFAWRGTQTEKVLWDVIYDPVMMKDPKTFETKPGLATSWDHSADYKIWTFKLRQGVQFHENWGEVTSEDVKWTVEQNLKPDAPGGDASFFRGNLDKIETPDKYTIVMIFKTPQWEVLTHFVQNLGYQVITSKKYMESVGEQKAALHPIGTGPYRVVEGKQGDRWTFEAVPNHWRVTPAFKTLEIRRIGDPGTRVAGIRSGEIDIGQVFGDYLDQAKRAGLRIVERPNSAGYWMILYGQTTSDRDDYCPKCPWAGDPNDPQSMANALKVRQALNLAVDKQLIIDQVRRGMGQLTPYMYWFFPFNAGYDPNWKVLPYDPVKAKQLMTEAGYPNGFEVKVNPVVNTFANDGPDMTEAVALQWEKNLGLKVKRVPEDWGSFLPKARNRKTNQTFFVYGGPPFDEPVQVWQRCCYTKGGFHFLADGPFDKEIEAALAELDPAKRAKIQHDLGQKMYEGYYAVPLGLMTPTWAVSKKVGEWPMLPVPMETNYEYITASGQ